MKVTNVRGIVGIQVGAQVFTSIDAQKNGMDMELDPVTGFVYITDPKSKEHGYFVHAATLSSGRCPAEEIAKRIAELRDGGELGNAEAKRGPGRPPKAT